MRKSNVPTFRWPESNTINKQNSKPQFTWFPKTVAIISSGRTLYFFEDPMDKASLANQQASPIIIPNPSPKESGPPSLRMLADDPLYSDLADRLDFGAYADALAGLIDKPETNTPLVLAINAPWGAGKSTLGLMVKRRLESKPSAAGLRPHTTCWFDAWMYDDAPSLASAFASHVARSAEEARPLWRKIVNPISLRLLPKWQRRTRQILFLGIVFLVMLVSSELWSPIAVALLHLDQKALQSALLEFGPRKGSIFLICYMAVLLACKAVAVLASVAKPISEFVKDPESYASSGSLEEVRRQLGSLIRQATPKGCRFVVFIDDLERCRPPKAVEILEVINQLLCQKDIVVIVMADMPGVAASVELKYKDLVGLEKGTFGRSYLQKIIQLQFDLPACHAAQLQKLVSNLVIQQGRTEQAHRRPRKFKLLFKSPAFRLLAAIFLAIAAVAVVLSIFELVYGGSNSTQNSLIAALPASVAAYGSGIVQMWMKSVQARRQRALLDGKLEELSSRGVTNPGDLDKELTAYLKTLKPSFLDRINPKLSASRFIAERIQRYIENESQLQQEAEEEVMKYLPPLPRNAKRLVNRLRLLLFVAYQRRMLGGQPELTARHIGKWAIINERWPEIAQAAAQNPALIETLEKMSDYDNFSAIAVPYVQGKQEIDELFHFFTTDPKLSSVSYRLIYFQSADESMTAKAANA
jgi:hypothetical protein